MEWHHAQTLASGQVAEFKVWAELVRQSLGDLHVFLPLRDRGVDGVLHRLSDGAYIAVQVKGRTKLTPARQVHITVAETSLADDAALIIATLIDGAELGRLVLVIDEKNFRALAARDVVGGRAYLTAAFEMKTAGKSRWAPHLVPRDRLAERFGAAAAGRTLVDTRVSFELDRGAEGFTGEAEVIRRLAAVDSLALFRPFPDLETVEVLVGDVASWRFLGLQVKTAGWDYRHSENRVYFRRSSFHASSTTLVTVLGLDRDTSRFADQYLLIPSLDVPELARVEGDWLVLELEPQSVAHRKLGRYMRPLDGLAGDVVAILEK